MRKPDLWAPIHRLARWPVTSQIGARRNALTASTALAQRRAERNDVERFLRALDRLQPSPVALAGEGSAQPVVRG
jgi:hypothetical protein